MRVWPIIDIRGDKDKCLDYLGYGKALLMRMSGWMTSSQVQQCAWRGSPAPGVAVFVEKRMAISRIFIDVTGGIKKKIIEKVQYYWYHIMTGGYRWFIEDLAIDRTGMIHILGGHAPQNPPEEFFGDYAVTVRFTPDGVPVHVKQWSENTKFSFGVDLEVGEAGYLYVLVDYFTNRAAGIYETMLVKMTTGGEIVWDVGIGDSANTTQVKAIQSRYHEATSTIVVSAEFEEFGIPDSDRMLYNLTCAFTSGGILLWKKFYRFPFTDDEIDQEVPWIIETTGMDIDAAGNSYTCLRSRYPTLASVFGDATVLSYDISGNFRWIKRFQTDPMDWHDTYAASDLITDDTDNIYFAFIDRETTDPDYSTGIMKYILVKVKKDGTGYHWAKHFLTVNWSGNIVLGFHVWVEIANAGDGVVMLLQAFDNSTWDVPGVPENDDWIVARLNSAGELLWAYQLHGIEWGCDLQDIKVDLNDNIIIAGQVYSQDRSFVIKLPPGPVTGKFHNFELTALSLGTPTNYTLNVVADEPDIIIEDADDMSLQTVAYTTTNMSYDTETLYKFFESKQTIEVQDG